MRPFHVSILARPEGNWPTATRTTPDGTLTQILVPPGQLAAPLAVSFEQAARDLAALPRLLLEPDGSFVWIVDRPGTIPGQIDGMLWDRGGTLHTVELKGSCGRDGIDRLLAVLRQDPQALLVLLMRHGVLVDVHEFKRLWCDS
jgi:hypothetical protein